MNATRRLRRLIPRFSIGNLLMLMVIVGLCAAWSYQQRKLAAQAQEIGKQRLEITRLTVNNIIRSDMTDEEKASAIAAHVQLGNAIADIDAWAGERASTVAMAFWRPAQPTSPLRIAYANCDLVVTCRSDGTVYELGYHKYLVLTDGIEYRRLTSDADALASGTN
jgi:hypothetical protein